MKTSAQRRTRLAKADVQGPDGGVDNCQASLSSHGRMGEEEERARKVGRTRREWECPPYAKIQTQTHEMAVLFKCGPREVTSCHQ